MGRRLTTNDFTKRAKQIHGDKYDYSKVNYVNNKTKVKIICPKHGEFWQHPYNHFAGNGCPKCKAETLGDLRRSNKDEFIEKAKKVHGDAYNYDKVNYIKSSEKVCIICPEHGEFWQRPGDHLSGKGCPKCIGRNKTTEEFIEQAKKVHGGRYSYNKVEYNGACVKVCIICPEHGEFWQTPDSHLRGSGCPKCADEHRNDNKKLNTGDFVKRAKEIHGNKYDYSKVNYDGADTKVCIICPEHGEFWQTPYKHVNIKQGCPKCAVYKRFEGRRENGTFNTSKIQDELYLRLKEEFGEEDAKREYQDNVRYPFHCDFYIKSLDLFIELNGIWTHGFHWFDENDEDDIRQLEEWKEKSQNSKFYQNAIEVWTERDVKKREHARKNDLNYVVFWGDCKNDINQWFDDGCPVRQDWK